MSVDRVQKLTFAGIGGGPLSPLPDLLLDWRAKQTFAEANADTWDTGGGFRLVSDLATYSHTTDPTPTSHRGFLWTTGLTVTLDFSEVFGSPDYIEIYAKKYVVSNDIFATPTYAIDGSAPTVPGTTYYDDWQMLWFNAAGFEPDVSDFALVATVDAGDGWTYALPVVAPTNNRDLWVVFAKAFRTYESPFVAEDTALPAAYTREAWECHTAYDASPSAWPYPPDGQWLPVHCFEVIDPDAIGVQGTPGASGGAPTLSGEMFAAALGPLPNPTQSASETTPWDDAWEIEITDYIIDGPLGWTAPGSNSLFGHLLYRFDRVVFRDCTIDCDYLWAEIYTTHLPEIVFINCDITLTTGWTDGTGYQWEYWNPAYMENCLVDMPSGETRLFNGTPWVDMVNGTPFLYKTTPYYRRVRQCRFVQDIGGALGNGSAWGCVFDGEADLGANSTLVNCQVGGTSNSRAIACFDGAWGVFNTLDYSVYTGGAYPTSYSISYSDVEFKLNADPGPGGYRHPYTNATTSWQDTLDLLVSGLYQARLTQASGTNGAMKVYTGALTFLSELSSNGTISAFMDLTATADLIDMFARKTWPAFEQAGAIVGKSSFPPTAPPYWIPDPYDMAATRASGTLRLTLGDPTVWPSGSAVTLLWRSEELLSDMVGWESCAMQFAFFSGDGGMAHSSNPVIGETDWVWSAIIPNQEVDLEWTMDAMAVADVFEDFYWQVYAGYGTFYEYEPIDPATAGWAERSLTGSNTPVADRFEDIGGDLGWTEGTAYASAAFRLTGRVTITVP